jgi:transposase
VRYLRWTFHFTPTSCSWLNAVEAFFAKLTKQRPKRGSFPSLVALQEGDQPLRRGAQRGAEAGRLDR